jgi:hypothetical protein
MFRFLSAMLCVLLCNSSFGGTTVYKCSKSDGSVVFSPEPCAANAKVIDTSGALRTGTSPNVQGVSDRAAISSIDGQCAAQQLAIDDNANLELARIEKEVKHLRAEMNISANNFAGATRDNGIRDQIAAAESRRDAVLSRQTTDTSRLAASCAERRAAETDRQAARDAATAGTPKN